MSSHTWKKLIYEIMCLGRLVPIWTINRLTCPLQSTPMIILGGVLIVYKREIASNRIWVEAVLLEYHVHYSIACLLNLIWAQRKLPWTMSLIEAFISVMGCTIPKWPVVPYYLRQLNIKNLKLKLNPGGRNGYLLRRIVVLWISVSEVKNSFCEHLFLSRISTYVCIKVRFILYDL